MSKKTMDLDSGLFKEIKKIKFGGLLFDLIFEEERNLTLEDIGQIDYPTETVTIHQNRKTKGELVLHEIHHEANRQTSLKLREEDVTRLSYFLYAAMRDNPELVIQILRENQEEEIDGILRKIAAPDH